MLKHLGYRCLSGEKYYSYSGDKIIDINGDVCSRKGLQNDKTLPLTTEGHSFIGFKVLKFLKLHSNVIQVFFMYFAHFTCNIDSHRAFINNRTLFLIG